MGDKFCEIRMAFEHTEKGSVAKGDFKFRGKGKDVCHVLSHLMGLLDIPHGTLGQLICLTAFSEYEANTKDKREEESDAVSFVEGAKEWR